MKVVSSKDLRIATTNGAVVLLQANVEREVSNTIGAIALQMGAKQVGEKLPVAAPEPVVDEPVTIEVSLQEDVDAIDENLVAALEKLIEIGNPQDFKADGTPKSAVVNRAVGRTVRSDERERAWEIALNS